MDEIQKVLSDPAAMEKITRMAQQLMGSGESASAPPPEAASPGLPGELLRGLKGMTGPHPLAAALAPYLGEERRRRLERALSAARAVRLSGSLLGRDGHGL